MATTEMENNSNAKENAIKQGELNSLEFSSNEIRSLKSMTGILTKLQSMDKLLENWTPTAESWKEIDAKRNTLNLLHECVAMLSSTSIVVELKLKGLAIPPSPEPKEPDYSQFLPQILIIQRTFRNFRIRNRTRRLSNAISNSVETQMAPQRTKLYKEIIDTERSYLTSIKLLINCFKVPFEKSNCVTVNEVNRIFSNIESIAKCSEQLLSSLEESDSMHVGVVFKDLAPYFNIYTLYVNNFDQSNLAFKELQDRPQFNQLMKTCTTNARKEANRNVDIFDLLIQPVQRIPRYQLLLEAMLKLTPVDHVSYSGLQAALTQIKKVADNINEQKRNKDFAAKIVEIQASIDDLPFNLVEAHRRFIYEGDMVKLWGEAEEFHFFLFNDILLFTFKANAMLLSWYGQPMLKYVSFLGLDKAKLVDVPDSPDSPRQNAFELQYDMDGKPRTFAFSCPSEKLKLEWMQHLKVQIEGRQNPNKITKKVQRMEGYLYKRGGIIKSWKLRYFVLNNSILYYYESKSDFVPLGKIVLERYVVRLSKIHKNAIELHHPTDRSYILYADNAETIKSWIVEFNRICAVENEVMMHYSVKEKAPLSENEDWEIVKN